VARARRLGLHGDPAAGARAAAVRAVQGAVARALAARPRGPVAVACSGGVDSMALAAAAIEVAGPARAAVIALDHGLAPGSERVAAGVVAWARGQGAHGIAERIAVPRRASLEAAARAARYAALDRIAAALGADTVLVGHTARDQAETVLLRILRGTGPAGLAGIPAARGRVVRPLLALPRAATEAYVAACALPTWPDPMNEERRLARVRVRAEVLPRLRQENPRLDAALVRIADSAAEWLAVIDAAAAPFAHAPIDCRALASQPVAIRKRAVAIALDRAGIDYAAPHLDAIDRLLTGPSAGTRDLHLPGARIVRSYDQLTLAPAAPRGGGAARVLDAPPAPPQAARADAQRGGPPPAYASRPWRPGDRMRPARLGGRSRKLSDLFIDAKVPRAARGAAVVVERVATGEIVWCEHIGRAHGEPPADPARDAVVDAIGSRSGGR
jgi:tRNA(Ile)-lysidine synthase